MISVYRNLYYQWLPFYCNLMEQRQFYLKFQFFLILMIPPCCLNFPVFLEIAIQDFNHIFIVLSVICPYSLPLQQVHRVPLLSPVTCKQHQGITPSWVFCLLSLLGCLSFGTFFPLKFPCVVSRHSFPCHEVTAQNGLFCLLQWVFLSICPIVCVRSCACVCVRAHTHSTQYYLVLKGKYVFILVTSQ